MTGAAVDDNRSVGAKSTEEPFSARPLLASIDDQRNSAGKMMRVACSYLRKSIAIISRRTDDDRRGEPPAAYLA
jgi:hypothetical protein